MALAGMSILLAAGCHKSEPKQSVAKPALPAITVKVAVVTSGQHEAHEEVVGTVRARSRATVEAKISGRILRLPLNLGQRVKQGDLVAELDVQEFQAKVEQARAVLTQAERDLERFSKLLKQEAVTRQEFEMVESRQHVARAALSEAETMLGYAKVVAPFDGVVSRKNSEVGDLASPGKPLIELETGGGMRFEASVSEALIDRIQTGGKFAVSIASSPESLTGTVSEIAPVAEAGSRTFLVKLDLHESTSLRAGQFGRMSIPVGRNDVLTVPASAVVKRGQLEYVFAVEAGRSHLRLVKTGKRLGDQVELISGVNAGEQVVTEGLSGLADGQPVEVKP